MRVALIVNSFPTLSETFIVNKVLGLQQAGLDVTVWTHSENNDLPAFGKLLQGHSQVKIRSALLTRSLFRLLIGITQAILLQPSDASILLRQSRRLYPNMRRGIRAWLQALPIALGRFDLIHFELSGLAVSYLDALPLLHPAKLLTSCRGAAEQITPLLYPERGQKLKETFMQMNAVHCVTADLQSTAEHYGLQPAKAFVNYPAIDVQEFIRRHPYPVKAQEPFRILSVGRLHWKKGFEFGLLAVAQLVQARFDVHYQIIGGGEEEGKLRYLIDALGLADHVKLSGRQPPEIVRQALEETDVFLLPSLSEGLSNAVLEAMAMEVPVVSTTAGGMAEAITDGQEGFLVPPMQPNVLAQKIQTLLENPEMRERMGKAGRMRVEQQFQLSGQIQCFLEKYSVLMQSNVTS